MFCILIFFRIKRNNKNSTLAISRQNFRSTVTPVKLWSDSTQYADVWLYGSITILNNLTSNYVLIVEGIVNDGTGSGDIGLDDFKIINGQECLTPDELCAFTCPNHDTCIPLAKVCDFRNDCENGEDELQCGYKNNTFEEDTGFWKTNNDTISKWERGKNGDNGNAGPSVGKQNLRFNLLICIGSVYF